MNQKKESAMETLDGHFLAASPQMKDPNFDKAVILLIQHDEHGAFGLVLNRPSNLKIRAIWEKAGEEPCQREGMLRLGGPIEGPLMAVHTRLSASEKEILPGVYFAAEKDSLREVVTSADEDLLLFSGYAGWGEGQLDDEMAAGAWMTLRATCDFIFDPDDELWRKVAKKIANSVIFAGGNIKHVPDDPSLN